MYKAELNPQLNTAAKLFFCCQCFHWRAVYLFSSGSSCITSYMRRYYQTLCRSLFGSSFANKRDMLSWIILEEMFKYTVQQVRVAAQTSKKQSYTGYLYLCVTAELKVRYRYFLTFQKQTIKNRKIRKQYNTVGFA